MAEPQPAAAIEERALVERSTGLQLVPSSGVKPLFTRDDLQEALSLVQQMDPVGVAARDVRECLLAQLKFLQQAHKTAANGNGTGDTLTDAIIIVSEHLRAVQNKQLKEIAKAIGRPVEAVQAALDLVKTLDPRPGLRYNKVVLATDADVDGLHIRNLLLTFFLRFFEPLVHDGFVYILETPLFRVRNSKKTVYCYSEEERDAAMKDLRGAEVTRFKGLGEISPAEFKYFIGPEMRLTPVRLANRHSVPAILGFYMGRNTPERRQYIMNHLVV